MLLIGNDSKLTDVDVANTAGLYGGQDNTVASIRLGSTGGTLSGYNGNVGIGTPGPESPFHVYAGSAGTVTASIQSDLTVEDDGHAFINLLAPNTNYTGIYFGDQDDNARWEFSTNHGTDKFQIKVSGSEKLTMNNVGNVGIGTTNPNSTFEVNGAIATAFFTTSSTAAITLDNTATVWIIEHDVTSINFPATGTCANRRYIIVNRRGTSRTTSAYGDLSGFSSTSIPANTSIEIIADPVNGWMRIK